MMKNTIRQFQIPGIPECILVEKATRKELLRQMDDYIEVISGETNPDPVWANALYDDSYDILYEDGSEECISAVDYNGHPVRHQHIASIVYENPSTYMVYGNFRVNEDGIVYPSTEEVIADCILEVSGAGE